MKTLELNGVAKTFRGKRGSKVDALKNVTLTLQKGEVFGFLGPNGAGKSTTIKIIMGLIRASAGTVHLFDRDVSDWKSRQSVGYLPENPAFFDYLKASEYLAMVGRIFGMTESRVRVESDRVLALVELSEASDRLIRSYSKGMVQRLGLAQAMLHDPDLYILDEPMSGLDPLGRILVREVILDLRSRGKTVFFSTHIISDVECVCDRLGIISQGTLRRVEKVDSIISTGVDDYVITYTPSSASSNYRVEEVVDKEDLQHYLRMAKEKNNNILSIEPHRRSLEDFFLATIRNHEC